MAKTPATSKSKKPLNFEQALGELEALVTAMESGEMSLEASLQAFEQGVRLTRDCQQALTEAEQKVQLLLSEEGDTTDFDTPAEAGDQP
jgi:exodeoxyribonuclease VII small subunit